MRRLPVTLSAIGSALLLAACSGPAQQPAQQSSYASPAPAAVKPEVSINAVMVGLVDHAGHELWNVEKEGAAPKTEADWATVQEHAVQLAAAGPAISVGGTGPSDNIWVQSPDWRKDAQAMSDAAMSAVNAAKGKNFEELVAANGRIVETCETCHKQFKPELPTEGIVHTHAH